MLGSLKAQTFSGALKIFVNIYQSKAILPLKCLRIDFQSCRRLSSVDIVYVKNERRKSKWRLEFAHKIWQICIEVIELYAAMSGIEKSWQNRRQHYCGQLLY